MLAVTNTLFNKYFMRLKFPTHTIITRGKKQIKKNCLRYRKIVLNMRNRYAKVYLS